MTLTQITLPEPWRAVLVLTPAFPVQSPDHRATLHSAVHDAAAELGLRAQPTREIFLQLWNLTPATGGNLLQEHMKTWQPEFGMGVWPNRKPPEGWTETSLMDNAAAVMLGEEPDMPNHRVLRLSSDHAVQQQAPALLRGCGTLIQIESPLPLTDVLQRAMELFLPRITEERFRDEPFYIPLVDVATLTAAKDVAELDSWMCGISGYVRESASDSGILIVSRSADH